MIKIKQLFFNKDNVKIKQIKKLKNYELTNVLGKACFEKDLSVVEYILSRADLKKDRFLYKNAIRSSNEDETIEKINFSLWFRPVLFLFIS